MTAPPLYCPHSLRKHELAARDTAIHVENLSKCFEIYERHSDFVRQLVYPRLQKMLSKQPRQYYRDFWALKDVTFEIKKGETVAIVGRNGSGKSTLLQLICGTLMPTSGSVSVQGRIAALLELGSGFNPEFTGRENVYMNAAILGLSQEETEDRFEDILAFADIAGFIDQPVRTYSNGMVVRLAFSVAISVNPEILIVDEALAVGDAAFQRKCIRRMGELTQSGVTLLFVSHDTETVKKLCSRAVYLNRGEVRHIGDAKETCTEYERDSLGASRGREGALLKSSSKATAYGEGRVDQELLLSDEKVYGDGRAIILDICLTNAANQTANVFNSGERFSVSYKVRFIEHAISPVFGMMITNREGMCVFGTNTTGSRASATDFRSGDEITVSFHLVNNLGPGIYYLTCGVYSDDRAGNIVYLQRRMDVLLLKSLGVAGGVTAGVVQLYPLIECSMTENCE